MPVIADKAVVCLVCDSPLAIDGDAEKGEIIECSACGQEHELTVAADGVYEVCIAPEVEEDWGE
ncbi:lysine biosynthesis protein LysW [Solwaraspora sp. WMMD937]|uniref:lysine biosynthesis protein LysW n=1 Tax=Solwaraspora sp. WMMD937 TaxID=3016090 RepID=UPI00249C4E3D|nr:lysine biosynthesis protein LysW [Solwaraspora sp. WMMD937]WFE20250.1 lysine biosynthesis protein LysW [Solwaraspora sp. WMMD937]